MLANMFPLVRRHLMDKLRAKGVTMFTGVKYEEITDEGLVVSAQEREKWIVEADTIVVAAGARPNNQLLKALEGKVR